MDLYGGGSEELEEHLMNSYRKRDQILAMIKEVLKEIDYGTPYVSTEGDRLRTFSAVDIDEYTMLIESNFADGSDYLEVTVSFSPAAPVNRMEETLKMIQIYNSRAPFGGHFQILSLPPRTVAFTTLVDIEKGIDKEAFRSELENAILSGTFFFPYLMKIFKGEVSAEEAAAEFFSGLTHVED